MTSFFECLAIIIGTMIGAGFVSGKEIQHFFIQYGNDGIYGIWIANILYGIMLIYLLWNIKDGSYQKYQNKFWIGFVTVFSFAVFCVMISSVGALVEQQWNMNRWYGIMISELVLYGMLMHEFKAVRLLSKWMTPFIILGIIGIAMINPQTIENELPFEFVSKKQTVHVIFSAILYASYNFLLIIPILTQLGKNQFHKKKIVGIGMSVTLMMSFLMIQIFKMNVKFMPLVWQKEIPNMYIASLVSKRFALFYMLVLLGAIYTTALTARL